LSGALLLFLGGLMSFAVEARAPGRRASAACSRSSPRSTSSRTRMTWKKFCDDAQSKRGMLTLKYPIDFVANLDDMGKICAEAQGKRGMFVLKYPIGFVANLDDTEKICAGAQGKRGVLTFKYPIDFVASLDDMKKDLASHRLQP